MNKEIIHLNINEYLAYILLYAANADFEMAKEELDIIRETVSRDDFNRIRRSFEASSDTEKLEVIMHYRDAYLNVLMDNAEVSNHLRSLFLADHHYNAVEKEVFLFLKRFLKL